MKSGTGYARHLLRTNRHSVFRRLLGLHQGVRQAVERQIEMDYIIAGIAAFFLFVYLIYALLRPEKF